MNQSGRLEGMAGGFVGHLCGCELAEFLVNERQQFRGCRGITPFSRIPESGSLRSLKTESNAHK